MSDQRIRPEQLSSPRRIRGLGVIAPALFAATCMLAAPASASGTVWQHHQAGGQSVHNSYAAPAYLVGRIRAPVIYTAPYEPYVDGGSVVGAPPRGFGFGFGFGW